MKKRTKKLMFNNSNRRTEHMTRQSKQKDKAHDVPVKNHRRTRHTTYQSVITPKSKIKLVSSCHMSRQQSKKRKNQKKTIDQTISQSNHLPFIFIGTILPVS